MLVSSKRITKALIRLCGSAGWSLPLLFAPPPPKTGFLATRPIYCTCIHSAYGLNGIFSSDEKLDILFGFIGTSTTKRTTTQTSTITTRRTTPGATSVHLVQVLLSIYSGNQDPVFNVFYNNANFSDIVATAESRASIPLNGFLGYRGFLVTLYSHVGK